MTYKRTLAYMVVTIIFFILLILTGIRLIPRCGVLLPGSVEATVKNNDPSGIYGYVNLYMTDEEGNKQYFHWTYPGKRDGLKVDEKVLVRGEIAYIDTQTGEGSNEELLVVGKTKVYLNLALFLFFLFMTLFFGIQILLCWWKKPWNEDEEKATKTNILYACISIWAIIFLIAIIGVLNGGANLGKFVMRKHHGTGTIVYVKNDAYNKSYSDSYLNVQVMMDEPVDGQEKFSRTYRDTVRILFKGQRAVIAYNDFTGSDGYLFTYAEIIFQISCLFLLILEFLAARKWLFKNYDRVEEFFNENIT